MGPRSRSLRFLIGLFVISAILALGRSVWLPWFGEILVHDDGPAKADIAVVLGGDYYGHRVIRAAQLVRQGYVPTVLVSGPPGMYGAHESDLAIPFAVRHGYPAAWFISFPHSALSTKEEAAVVLPELQRRGVRSFLLVTSDYHTARAARIFRAAGRSQPHFPSMRVVAVADEFFRPRAWWRNRESQKTAFFEWCKTFATAVGM